MSEKNRSRAAYSPNMDLPSRKKSGASRALKGLILTLLLPPVGIGYLWRKGVFRARGRVLLSAIATVELALLFMLALPETELSNQAPMPVVPVAATIAPDNGVVSALDNLDALLAQRQAELNAAAGITPEPTVDIEARRAEQDAILQTTVYSVYGYGAQYYHKDTVCNTQSNRRPLTVEEALGEGLGACPECDPPVFQGYSVAAGT